MRYICTEEKKTISTTNCRLKITIQYQNITHTCTERDKFETQELNHETVKRTCLSYVHQTCIHENHPRNLNMIR